MEILTGLVANAQGEIFELEGYAAVGMQKDLYTILKISTTTALPFGGELMYLPARSPILFNMTSNDFEVLEVNPFNHAETIFPVAAFNSPGYVNTAMSAYVEKEHSEHLPLFSYGAVGWYLQGFRSAVVRVDEEDRQDLRKMPQQKILRSIKKIKKQLPENRLRVHLEKCALEYGCPAAKNFFLGRYEAPLPTSRHCNAACLGCLSHQTADIPVSQERINFKPTPEEIAAIACFHFARIKNPIASFGQGCEGDPLKAVDVIEPAIHLIRSNTDKGTINMNTNGSKIKVVKKLLKAGLDSIRISMNSVRSSCYEQYFRPQDYSFKDVIKSIDHAIAAGKFVSLNYLNMPGFTDTPEEIQALLEFIRKHPINMIQWRNLNYDPLRYLNKMPESGHPLGMAAVIKQVSAEGVQTGYFNPAKENFNREEKS